MTNDVLDVIIYFVKSYRNETKENKPNIQSNFKGKKYHIWNADYLLNQILRQISIPEDHILLSKAAKEKWEQLNPSGKKGSLITNYYYHEKLKAHCNEQVKVKCYKGAETKEYKTEIKNGEVFIFRDVFHYEHTIPISAIIKELLKVDEKNNLNYDSVSRVLNKMYICRMLKEEDRNIDEKYDRSIELEEVLEKVYKPKQIYIVK